MPHNHIPKIEGKHLYHETAAEALEGTQARDWRRTCPLPLRDATRAARQLSVQSFTESTEANCSRRDEGLG